MAHGLRAPFEDQVRLTSMGEWRYDYDHDVASVLTVIEENLRPGFTFVNIGAHDGVLNDPCWPFIERYGWSGVCVEPVPAIFDRLAENYAHLPQVQLVQAAISSTPRSFWYVENADFVTAQAGSLDQEQVNKTLFRLLFVNDIEQHYPTGLPPAAAVEDARRSGTVASLDVECLTFDELTQRCGLDRIDMINIDVEGCDWEVLQMIDLDRHLVSVAVVETECRTPQ